MPHSAASKQPPTVFISYAHESDALRASVATLAEWLRRRGCRVLTVAELPQPLGEECLARHLPHRPQHQRIAHPAGGDTSPARSPSDPPL